MPSYSSVGGFGRAAMLAAGVAGIALLAGCKPVGPNYHRPAYNAPAAYKEVGAPSVVPPPSPANTESSRDRAHAFVSALPGHRTAGQNR